MTVAICLFTGTIASYAFSRFNFAGRTPLMLGYLVVRMFPAVLMIIPLFIVMRNLGLFDTSIGLAIAYTSFLLPLFVWMLKGFFDAAPRELESAADTTSEEALALYDVIDQDAAGVPHYRAYAYVKAGRRPEAERLAAKNDQYPYRATIIYAALGDLDRAFEALEKTAEREPQRVPLLLTWPEMAPLRADPRLTAFRNRFRLP